MVGPARRTVGYRCRPAAAQARELVTPEPITWQHIDGRPGQTGPKTDPSVSFLPWNAADTLTGNGR
jgi:hypothetical protein